MKTAKDDASLKMLYVSGVNVGSAIANIAHEVAAGELRTRQKRGGEAAKLATTARPSAGVRWCGLIARQF